MGDWQRTARTATRSRTNDARRITVWSLALLVTICLWSGPAYGQSHSGQAVRSFDIPPQSLSSALLQYSEATNQEVMVDASLTQGLQSQGVSGEHTPEAALSAILAGTGLTYLLTGSGAMTVIKAPVPAATPGSPSSELPGDTPPRGNSETHQGAGDSGQGRTDTR